MTISGDLTLPSGVGQQVHGPHVMPAQVWELGVGAWCGSLVWKLACRMNKTARRSRRRASRGGGSMLRTGIAGRR
jgi:hypothetical protein